MWASRACPARRETRAYREYVNDEQRRWAGCIGGKNGGFILTRILRTLVRGGLTRALLAMIAVYKVALSPLFAGSCRFVPSCSSYAWEAVEKHGPLKGGWLALQRLARCHPFCDGGLDQVPETGEPTEGSVNVT